MQPSSAALFLALCGIVVSGAGGARRLVGFVPAQAPAPVNVTSSRELSLTSIVAATAVDESLSQTDDYLSTTFVLQPSAE